MVGKYSIIYGYVRISTSKQSMQRQINNIKKRYPNAVIIQEIYTGTKLDRPKWNKLFAAVQKNPNCLIVFDEVSRMSRDADEGYELYMKLYDMGISLEFIKEPHINTDTYRQALDSAIRLDISSGDSAADKLISSVIEALNEFMKSKVKQDIRLAFDQAEKEVEYLHQRTREGIATARLNGKQIGRKTEAIIVTQKSIKAKEIIKKFSKNFNGTLKDIDVIKLAGITPNSYYKYKRELKEALENQE